MFVKLTMLFFRQTFLYAAGFALVLSGCQAWPPPVAGKTTECCGGMGACLPQAFLSPGTAAMLGQAECEAGRACVPDELRVSPAPPHCKVHGAQAEGRCLPECLPMVHALADSVAADGCAGHQRCVPCYNPLTGAATSACSLNEDAPGEPPRTFAQCCADRGRCVPDQLVPAEQRKSLGQDSCAATTDLCVPQTLLDDPKFVPATCSVRAFGAEGRCLPACLRALDSARDRLQQDGCAKGELCAPCFDPFTGLATGSCTTGGDPGPKQPPKVFGHCCGAAGRCLPKGSVPAAQKPLLGPDQCDPEQALCVPEVFISQPDFVPAQCRASAWGSEGRCLWECLPKVAERAAALSRDGCDAGQLCVPCHDPLTGQPSGACELNGDAPKTVAKPAAYCCEQRGRCVPESLIPAQSVAQFGREGCDQTSTRCVAPTSLLAAEPVAAPSCQDPRTGARGRCLPDCLPEVNKRAASLVRADCAKAELCVPCFDPLTGAMTPACTQPGDRGPTEPKVVFDKCCMETGEALGACVPTAALPSGLPQLPAQTCQTGSVCAPRVLVEDPGARLASCTQLTGAGVCVPACFLGNDLTVGFLSQATCRANERCVPCSALGPGISGC